MQQLVKRIQQPVGLAEVAVSLGPIITTGVIQLVVLQQLIVTILVNTMAILIGHALLEKLLQQLINVVEHTVIVDKREKEVFFSFLFHKNNYEKNYPFTSKLFLYDKWLNVYSSIHKSILIWIHYR